MVAEIESLKFKNDSLKNLLSEIDDKYVFDSIKSRIIPNPENSYKLNSDYEFELVFAGFNASKDSTTHYEESTFNGRKTNAYTITNNNGGIKIKTKLTEELNYIVFDVDERNRFGKSIMAKCSDRIKVKN